MDKDAIAAEMVGEIFELFRVCPAPRATTYEERLRTRVKAIVIDAMEAYGTTDECATWREQAHANVAERYREHACDANRRTVQLYNELRAMGYTHETLAEVMSRGRKIEGRTLSDDMATAAQNGSARRDS